jgi:hypothetical protein
MDTLEMSRNYLRMDSSRTRKNGWKSLLLALIAVTGVGCAQLLGLEDLRERADGGVPARPDSGQPPDAAILDCTASTECIEVVPICDLGQGTCRACALDQECADRDPQSPICAPDGRCGECASDPNCTDPLRPVCDPDALTCRGCQAHDECASTVCDIDASTCVDPSLVVYVSSSGSFATGCGTQSEPCRSIYDSVAQVTFERPYLRLTGTFQDRLTLSGKPFRVIAEGATLDLTPVDFDPGIAGVTVNMNAEVLIDGLRVTNLSVGGGIDCSQGELTLQRVTVDSNEGMGVSANECPLNIQESRILDNSERGVNAYTSTGAGSLVIERSLIADNYRGGIDANIAPLLIRNNLILRNSNLGEYQGAIRLNGGSSGNSFITYNTFVGNMVNQNYIGIIGCGGAVLSSNIIWGNMYPPDSDVDQTIIGCDQVRNNLSDSMLENRPQNYLGDPLFVQAADDDYHLLPGSPALDLGEPELANLIDYDGKPRPQGAGPDIGALEAPAP